MESPVPQPTPCLYLIYKYRDVYMMALALSVFADAVRGPNHCRCEDWCFSPATSQIWFYPARVTFDARPRWPGLSVTV